jgi:hypothetical protein
MPRAAANALATSRPRRNAAPRDLFGVKLKPPRDKNAEARRQAAIVEFVRWVAPQIVIWHVPNGGYRTKAEAGRLKWIGVLKGVLDLTLMLPEGRTAYWETKTPRTYLSDDQKDFIAKAEALGHTCALVRSIDDARRELARLGVATREAVPCLHSV